MSKVKLLVTIVMLATVALAGPLGDMLVKMFVDKEDYFIQAVWIWEDTPVWPLAQAVNSEQAWRIKQLAKEHPEWLDYQEPKWGITLLYWAVGNGKYNSTKALLEAGADPNILMVYEAETALFLAADNGWGTVNPAETKYVKLLLEHGASPNICFQGTSPEYAKKRGQRIIDKGASPLMVSLRNRWGGGGREGQIIARIRGGH